MRPAKITLAALLLGLFCLWLFSDTPRSSASHDPGVRHAAIQLTGILALGSMCFATLLAARPRRLEPLFDGLDKMYLLHKWLGVAALVASVAHWWFTIGSHLVAASGGGPHGRPTGAGGQSQSLLDSLRGAAHPIGEWGFYILMALIAIALLKRIPYRYFAYSHISITAVFLALMFHGVLLTAPAYWSQPIGGALAALCLGGLVGALLVLARRVGLRRASRGTVESQIWYPELRVLETAISLDGGWTGHRPGQFAFVSTSRFEGAHPFSIASDWDAATRRIVFIAKALGDYSAHLPNEFRPGRKVRVEGPYGRFDFEDGRASQIWIAAGVGITPFIGRMKQLARSRSAQTIHLFHTTADVSDVAIEKTRADAEAAGVTLHLTLSSHAPLLDGAQIRALVPGWQAASLWFCGPAAFGISLRQDFLHHGLASRNFHQERFTMR